MSVKKSLFYRQINVLKRVGGHLCKLGKLNVYYSFIMSNFKLLSSRLAFFCGEVNTKKIEKKKIRKGHYVSFIMITLQSTNLSSLNLNCHHSEPDV